MSSQALLGDEIRKRKKQAFVVFQCLLKLPSRFIQLSRKGKQKVTELRLHVDIEIKHYD